MEVGLVSTKAAALEVREATKVYPGVRALDNVSIEIARGQIVGLCGANGAGKSTLVKTLSGAQQLDEGEIYLRGRRVALTSPKEAREAGIYTIHQEMSLVPELSVLHNIFLDEFGKAHLFVNTRSLEERAKRILNRLGLKVDMHAKVSTLSMAQQQFVEIAKALKSDPAIVLLDEPTTTLPPRDVGALMKVMRDLARDGVSLIFISHRLDEVSEICDVTTILRDGKLVAHYDHVPTHATIVKDMIGTSASASAAAAASDESGVTTADTRLGTGQRSEVVLQVHGLTDGVNLKPTSLTLHRGEVLGITGLLGAGQNELAECIFGARVAASGTVVVNGRNVKRSSPHNSVKRGMGIIPEDRKTHGLVLGMSTMQNITLASLPQFARMSVLSGRKEAHTAKHYVDELRIKCTSVHQSVSTMSGGNQQKALLARWLTRRSDVLVLAEPTRGVDVAAKEEIYRLIRQYVQNGGSAILVTSELPEAALADRIMVMANGTAVTSLEYETYAQDRDTILEHLR